MPDATPGCATRGTGTAPTRPAGRSPWSLAGRAAHHHVHDLPPAAPGVALLRRLGRDPALRADDRRRDRDGPRGPALAWLRANGPRTTGSSTCTSGTRTCPTTRPSSTGTRSRTTRHRLPAAAGPAAAQRELRTDRRSRPHQRLPPAASRGCRGQIDTRDDFRTLIDGYDIGIRFFDDTLGRIVDILGELGILDETAIVVSSDHGENQGELGLYDLAQHRRSVTCRVPLVDPLARARYAAVRRRRFATSSTWRRRCASCSASRRPPAGTAAPSPRPSGRPRAGPRPPRAGSGRVVRAALRCSRTAGSTCDAARGARPDARRAALRRAHDPHEQDDLAAKEPARLQRARLARRVVAGRRASVGEDPLLAMAREGGAYYPRMFRDNYLARLRASGRDWAAAEIERRHIAPVPDRFDLDRW